MHYLIHEILYRISYVVFDIMSLTLCQRHYVKDIMSLTCAQDIMSKTLCQKTLCLWHYVFDIMSKTLRQKTCAQDIMSKTLCQRHYVKDIMSKTLCQKTCAQDIMSYIPATDTHENINNVHSNIHAFWHATLLLLPNPSRFRRHSVFLCDIMWRNTHDIYENIHSTFLHTSLVNST